MDGWKQKRLCVCLIKNREMYFCIISLIFYFILFSIMQQEKSLYVAVPSFPHLHRRSFCLSVYFGQLLFFLYFFHFSNIISKILQASGLEVEDDVKRENVRSTDII